MTVSSDGVAVYAGTGSGTVFKWALQGDLNSNGVVDLQDAVLALQVLSGIMPGQRISSRVGVNGDGKIGLPELI